VVLAGLIRLTLKKVTLPTFILEPRSFLEKCSDFMLHGKIMEKLIAEQDPVERFMIVCRWYLAGWHFKPPVCVCVCMCVRASAPIVTEVLLYLICPSRVCLRKPVLACVVC
jgi:hypothetical protein